MKSVAAGRCSGLDPPQGHQLAELCIVELCIVKLYIVVLCMVELCN